MPENDSKKTVKVSTVVIIVIAVVVVLALIFGAILFFILGSNKNDEPKNETNTVSQINSQEEQESNKNLINNEMEDNLISNTSSNSSTQVAASTNISDDWKECEFIINNQPYKLYFDYATLKNNGWTFDLSDYGYENGYIMNKDDKVSGTIDLENESYDTDITVGFINDSETAKDITECKIWSISVDNAFVDDDENPISFTLSKGIHNGSSLQDVVNAYGEPTDTYRADSLGYWVYTYQYDYSTYLKLTIYDDKGVTAFDYSLY